MPASRPLLSLCLATCNRAHYLERYLTHHLTAFETAGIDYEVVVSDNASSDDTPGILAAWAERYPRMRVMRQPHNLGAYPNILTTLREARGEFVVSISDDDLAVPHQLLAYVETLAGDPALAMIQAPWYLIDETQDDAITGKFYDFEGEQRFGAHQYARCLAFVLENHVFPECWIARRSALPSLVGPTTRFAHSYFVLLANALGQGDVLFSPEPHIAATAVAKGANAHVGNSEAMEGWDVYRGGLEWLTSCARQSNPGVLPDAITMGAAITGFVCERMVVAARLQVHARNWSNAYQILRRLHAYEVPLDMAVPPDDIARLAAVETALAECAQRGASQIVVADGVPDHVLERMNLPAGAHVIRSDGVAPTDVRRGYVVVGEAAHDSIRLQDFTSDIVAAMNRFPTFGG
ncbi:MAG: glycosyltransferase family 2 protein [Phenylobacterium sp.]|uniref:glycosyltransferase family 2 protein n=1 Tax=Phenylobacterium sp. TaxID=1871053 RepID=UPI001A550AAB|nr:glycosyltransferase family 2 protein [Phenylobacterium sp.]MBL8556046.1 glycosyltransferase family 2 protein [Phenylobacterium sp.]